MLYFNYYYLLFILVLNKIYFIKYWDYNERTIHNTTQCDNGQLKPYVRGQENSVHLDKNFLFTFLKNEHNSFYIFNFWTEEGYTVNNIISC